MSDTRPVLFVSFSGGRTSAYMTWLVKQHWSTKFRVVVTFANTSREDPRTLDFVDLCDLVLGFETVWLEAVVHPAHGVGTTHRVTSYQGAKRNGEVFEDVIRKYGVPNLTFQCCNRELKLRALQSYRRSIGAGHALVAIGIRADEPKRVPVARDPRILYPLVDTWPTDKQDVLAWFEDQAFDLEIDEFEGNCRGCFKKSFNKHFAQIERDPSVYEWTARMEKLYGHVGPQEGRRVFFRGHRDTFALLRLYEESKGPRPRLPDADASGGCTESCEAFEGSEIFDAVGDLC